MMKGTEGGETPEDEEGKAEVEEAGALTPRWPQYVCWQPWPPEVAWWWAACKRCSLPALISTVRF